MIKGKAQIEQDIYDTLAPFFEGRINGELYPGDTRPRDSRCEDAVIVAATPGAEQYQQGRVRILIYIPDIDNASGRPVPDLERVQELEQLAEPILDLLNDTLLDYAFEFLTAPDTGHDPSSSEHFVNIHLQYKRQTF